MLLTVLIVICIILCIGIYRGYPSKFSNKFLLLGIQLTLLGIFFLIYWAVEQVELFIYLAVTACVFGTVLSILFAFKEK